MLFTRNSILKYFDYSFTTTGTIGLQASINGLISFLTPSYYSNKNDFLVYKSKKDFDNCLNQIGKIKKSKTNIIERQKRLVKNIYDISFKGSIFSFFARKNFNQISSLDDLIKSILFYLKHITQVAIVS